MAVCRVTLKEDRENAQHATCYVLSDGGPSDVEDSEDNPYYEDNLAIGNDSEGEEEPPLTISGVGYGVRLCHQELMEMREQQLKMMNAIHDICFTIANPPRKREVAAGCDYDGCFTFDNWIRQRKSEVEYARLKEDEKEKRLKRLRKQSEERKGPIP